MGSERRSADIVRAIYMTIRAMPFRGASVLTPLAESLAPDGAFIYWRCNTVNNWLEVSNGSNIAQRG